MPGCIVSAMTASFRSVEKRRRRAMPVITSTFENVSDIGVCLGLYLGPPAKAGVRSKQGAVQSADPGAGTMAEAGRHRVLCLSRRADHSAALGAFRYRVIYLWRRSLRRRSQKGSTWQRW